MFATAGIMISPIIKARYILLSIRNNTACNAQFGYAGFCPRTQPPVLLLTTTTAVPEIRAPYHATQLLPDTSYVILQWRTVINFLRSQNS